VQADLRPPFGTLLLGNQIAADPLGQSELIGAGSDQASHRAFKQEK
jgi:hypothetical protein